MGEGRDRCGRRRAVAAHAVDEKVAEQIHAVFGRVLSRLGLSNQQRRMMPAVLAEEIATMAVAAPRAIEGRPGGRS